MQVGDLIREKEFPEDSCGIIVHVGDLRTKEPYKVWCPYWEGFIAFDRKYIEKDCEVVSEA
jgi:hypothetical protein